MFLPLSTIAVSFITACNNTNNYKTLPKPFSFTYSMHVKLKINSHLMENINRRQVPDQHKSQSRVVLTI